MHHHDVGGDFRQRDRPIDRAVAAAGDDDALIGEILTAFDEIEHRAVLVMLQTVERRPVGAERARSAGDDDRAAGDGRPLRGLDQPAAFMRLQSDNLLAQMIPGFERRGLFGKLLDQRGRFDLRKARNIENRLFGIERHTLPADGVERIDDVTGKFQHPAFEDREQSDRTRADDDDVGAKNFG